MRRRVRHSPTVRDRRRAAFRPGLACTRWLRALMLACAVAGRGDAQPSARTTQFDEAVVAFESGNSARTISVLAAYERSHGTSPRLESLRALAFRDLGRPMEAHRALLVYFRLTARRDMSRSTAHADLQRLRTEMLEAVETEYRTTNDSLATEREEVSTGIVEELASTYASPAVRIASSSALPASIRQALARDPSGSTAMPSDASASGTAGAAESALWARISQSTVAMDFFLFAETFPDGRYAESARQRMMQIGDPQWNAVRDSFVPAELRAFIAANPDNPFRQTAAEREQVLVGIEREWEAILADDSRPDAEKQFEGRYRWHPLGARARQLREQRMWARIEGSAEPDALRAFATEFPESPRAAAALARYAEGAQREFAALTVRFPQYGGTLRRFNATSLSTFTYVVNGPCSLLAARLIEPSDDAPLSRTEFPVDLRFASRIRVYSSAYGLFAADIEIDREHPITSKTTIHSRNPKWGPYVPRGAWEREVGIGATPSYESTVGVWIGQFSDRQTAERFKADYETLVGYCLSVKSAR